MSSFTIYPDKMQWIEGAARLLAADAAAAIAARGRWLVALAGGSTPTPIYRRLIVSDYAQSINWSRVHVFFGDERCVPPDDADSNYRSAREALLEHVPLLPQHVHRMHGEDEPEQAARAYEHVLKQASPHAPPVLDLICLGMGEDGHTASLFPGADALHEHHRTVLAQYGGAARGWRITLTLPVINAARRVVFLVQGAGKADTLRRVLQGPLQPDVLPAQAVRPTSGALCWLVDAAAAATLQPQEGFLSL